MALVILRGNLFKNEELEDVILWGYSETNAHRADLSLVFLSLFMSWNYLSSLFIIKRAILEAYEKFCLQIWVKCELRLLPHV